MRSVQRIFKKRLIRYNLQISSEIIEIVNLAADIAKTKQIQSLLYKKTLTLFTMEDYINYIDFNALSLGDVACELGDYQIAIGNYSKVIDRLRNYQGDSMVAISMASDLVQKIEEIRKRVSNSSPVLKNESWLLTKSSFVKGSQCLKYLFLDKYKKKEKTPPSKETLELFKQGHLFEEKYRTTVFPKGINVKNKVGNFAYFNSFTSHILDQSPKVTLFEATFIEDGVLVMCDVADKTANNKIDFYEVKLNLELNESILNDLAIQYYVTKKRFNSQINSFNLVMRSDDADKGWKVLDMKTELEKHLDSIKYKIDEFRETLLDQNNEPAVQMGLHCKNPYTCEFTNYCTNVNQVPICDSMQ